MVFRASIVAVLAVAAVALVGSAFGGSGTAMQRAQSAGWDCNPPILIVGYFHCAPPGKPSVADIATPPGSNVPSVELRVFNPDGSFAGTESLKRSDLYSGQPCPQDNLETWDLLVLPGADYRACHHFDA